MKQQKKTKGIILNGLKLLIAIASVFIIAIATQEISQKMSSSPIETEPQQAQVERQTEVPEGYTGIYDAAGLKAMADDLAGKYILMADIDMTGETWTPIGNNNSTRFTGVFDGNLYTISNLSIKSNIANVGTGMFSSLGVKGSITNLTLENISIIDTYSANGITSQKMESAIGGLVGYNYGIIDNVKVIGKISHVGETTYRNLYLGGIAGKNCGTINNSEMNGNVSNNGYKKANVGGLVGYNDGNINYSCSIGKIESINDNGNIVGGLIGYSYNSTNGINNCYSKVSIKTETYDGNIGGLIGYNRNTTINNSYSVGDITTSIYNTDTTITGRIGGKK